MVRPLILILCLSQLAFAKPPVEGGRDAPLSSFEYIDVLKIERSDRSTCSSTRVSPVLILTAAHCVTKFENGAHKDTVTAGSYLPSMGKVVKVSIHPKYKEANKKKLENRKDRNLSRISTLYDVAFIEVEPRASKRTMEYPKIISPKTELSSRKNMGMAGYGATETFWNGKGFEFGKASYGLKIADNSWEECPLDYFGNELSSLEKFKNEIKEHLQIRASRVHTIVNGNEIINYQNEGMVLPGDSGSPSLERDASGKLVVTGVASSILDYSEGSGHGVLVIEVDGKEVVKKEFEEMPENWGLKSKTNKDFPEIQGALEAQGLLNEQGEPKSGVVIKRRYTRVTDGNYADLAHPENQKFIQSVMKN